MTSKYVQKRKFTFFIRSIGDREPVESDAEYVKKLFSKGTRRWVFQLERGDEEGHLHFQGRISYKQPCTVATVAKRYPKIGISVRLEHDEDESTYYCLKEETRVAGPWTSKDRAPLWLPPCYDVELNVWQGLLKQKLEASPPRRVVVVIDTKGCSGKTTFVINQECKAGAFSVPPTMFSAHDMIQYLCNLYEYEGDIKTKRVIFIDLPRAFSNEEKWDKWLTTVEMIADGRLYDQRYKGRRLRVNPPTVCVMCNTCPPLKRLTTDRWDLNFLHLGKLYSKTVEEQEAYYESLKENKE